MEQKAKTTAAISFFPQTQKEAIAPANHLLSENNLLEQWLLLY